MYNKYAYLQHRLTNAEASLQPEILHILRPSRYKTKSVKLIILSNGAISEYLKSMNDKVTLILLTFKKGRLWDT